MRSVHRLVTCRRTSSVPGIVSFALMAACLAGCAGANAGSRSPGSTARVPWSEAPLSGAGLAEDVESVRAAAEASDLEARVARLDRLLDLYDAARFSGEAAARDALWASLGVGGGARGPEASRDVLNRLLQEAWAVEDAHPDAGEDAGAFLADFISLVSVDLNLPVDAESVSIQTLAYRQVAESGHPRLSDNARWRLYDHVRGVLTAAVESGAIRGTEIAAHALYSEQEQIEDQLEDTAPHARPERPSPRALWDLLEAQRAPLAANPRWAPVVEGRAQADEELRDLVLESLPQVRDPSWPLARLPAGTGHAESLAPVMLVSSGRATVRPTSPHPATHAPSDAALVSALEGALASDGRGIVLLAADPMLPSPDLHAALGSIAAARVNTIELAVLEPRVAPRKGDVIVALPLHLAHVEDLSPASQSFVDARVRIHLTGRGPIVGLDGQAVSEDALAPSEFEPLLDQIALAYPRESLITVTLADDVMFQQLLDLLVALSGNLEPRFAAVGWLVEGQPTAAAKVALTRQTLEKRAQLGAKEHGSPTIEQPYPLQPGDQKRLEEQTKRLAACLPELERDLPKGGLSIELQFEEGHLRIVEAIARKLDERHADAVEDCARDVFAAFRLREHRDLVSATAHFARD